MVRSVLAAGDETAGVDPAVGHASRDRGADLSELEIELRSLQGGLGRLESRIGGALLLHALIVGGARDRGASDELLCPRKLKIGEFDLRAGARQAAPPLRRRRLDTAWGR